MIEKKQRQRAAMVEWQSAGSNRMDLLTRKRLLDYLICEALTQRQRDCLLAYYRDRRTQKEIAEAMGVSVSTVSRHIRAGREALASGVRLSEQLGRAGRV